MTWRIQSCSLFPGTVSVYGFILERETAIAMAFETMLHAVVCISGWWIVWKAVGGYKFGVDHWLCEKMLLQVSSSGWERFMKHCKHTMGAVWQPIELRFSEKLVVPDGTWWGRFFVRVTKLSVEIRWLDILRQAFSKQGICWGDSVFATV